MHIFRMLACCCVLWMFCLQTISQAKTPHPSQSQTRGRKVANNTRLRDHAGKRKLAQRKPDKARSKSTKRSRKLRRRSARRSTLKRQRRRKSRRAHRTQRKRRRTRRKQRRAKRKRRTRRKRRRARRERRRTKRKRRRSRRKRKRARRERQPSAWRQKQIALVRAFLKQVGPPKTSGFRWADYGFPARVGAFPLPTPLIPRIRLWNKVFGDYPSNTVLLYDVRHFVLLGTVRVPGAALLPGEPGSVRRAKSLRRRKAAEPAFRQILSSLRKLAKIEQKVESVERSHWWKWYKKCKYLPQREQRKRCQKALHPGPQRYRKARWERAFAKLKGADRMLWHRVKKAPQWQSPAWPRLFRDMSRAGLGWKTSYRAFVRKGLKIERIYGPHMRAILRRANLPEDLAALPFVESMYNPWVRSFVGALGLWQIMPPTGREVGLYIAPHRWNTHFLPPIDEREDPLFATKAAARFIKLCRYFFRNSWPLAMTSYNQGPGRVLKVIRRTRTRKLHQMIQRASKRTFGPDGRNFYAKFVAAVLLQKQATRKFSAPLRPLKFRTIRLKSPIWLKDFQKHTGLSQQQLILYNPMLRYLFKHNSNIHPIPAHFPLRLPKRRAGKLSLKLKTFLFNQPSRTTYLARRGDSIGRVASRFRLSTEELLQANPLLKKPQLSACLWPVKTLEEYREKRCHRKCSDPDLRKLRKISAFRALSQWCHNSSKHRSRCRRAMRRWKSYCYQRQKRQNRTLASRRLKPKTSIYIPAVSRAAPEGARLYRYRVLGNEPLSLIACRSCTTVWHLRKINKDLGVSRLRPGTILRVPQCTHQRRRFFRQCYKHNYRRKRRRSRRRRKRRRRRR